MAEDRLSGTRSRTRSVRMLSLGLVWMRARILALVNSATLTVNYGVK